MINPQSILVPCLPADSWQLAGVCVEGYARLAVNVTKRTHRRAQGCFLMTD